LGVVAAGLEMGNCQSKEAVKLPHTKGADEKASAEPRNRTSASHDATAIDLVRAGWSIQQAAQELDIGQKAARVAAAKVGLEAARENLARVKAKAMRDIAEAKITAAKVAKAEAAVVEENCADEGGSDTAEGVDSVEGQD